MVEYSAEDYITKEDVYVIVTRDGWVKRQRSYTDLDAIRVREGDRVLYALAASTRATVGFLTSAGRCYTMRADDLPQTTGYGDPVQKYFDFADKETVVGVVSFDDPRAPDGRAGGRRRAAAGTVRGRRRADGRQRGRRAVHRGRVL